MVLKIIGDGDDLELEMGDMAATLAQGPGPSPMAIARKGVTVDIPVQQGKPQNDGCCLLF